jgi:phenylpropionate dioxygenase-like ring-hydroxylating dioxygenase large terminal subunit
MTMAHELEKLVDFDGGTLSARVFNDPEIYRMECERIFGTGWLFLCHESQLPKAGDFFTTYMAEDPVVVVRQKDGGIAAFLNQCRHRGMRICRADQGNARTFTCAYHGWSYDLGGRLASVPKEECYSAKFDKTEWGARRVTRVESYKGLVFGCWSESAPSLTAYLGAAAFYLDGLVDRLDGGTEVAGGVHKWVVHCNWKMGAEQFISDMYHAPITHVSAIEAYMPENYDPERQSPDSREGRQWWTPQGHGGGYFTPRMEANPPIWVDPIAQKWLRETYDEAVLRVGPLRAGRTSGHTTLFPNFSYLGGVNTLRVWHPRGPNQIEVWSWALVDRKAPEQVKAAFRRGVLRAFGPSGMLEQDDGENWGHVQAIMRGHKARDTKLCYQMGASLDPFDFERLGPHVGSVFADRSARNFYKRWLELMTAERIPA